MFSTRGRVDVREMSLRRILSGGGCRGDMGGDMGGVLGGVLGLNNGWEGRLLIEIWSGLIMIGGVES